MNTSKRMKLGPAAMLTLGLALSVAAVAIAQQANESAEIESPKAQTHCPIMKGPIDREVFADYGGQRIYFCCAGCSSPFLEDPEKHLAAFGEAGIEVESIQRTCPVDGEPIDPDVSLPYHGRRVFFHTEECRAAFDAEPAKYLKKVE